MKLTEYMREHELDDERMAARIGCSSYAVRKWKYGERIPRPEQLAKIAEATGWKVRANDFVDSPAPPAKQQAGAPV